MAYDSQRQRRRDQDGTRRIAHSFSGADEVDAPHLRSFFAAYGRSSNVNPRQGLSRQAGPAANFGNNHSAASGSNTTRLQPSSRRNRPYHKSIDSDEFDSAHFHSHSRPTLDPAAPHFDPEAMSYSNSQQRPLIDLIPSQDLDVSDEEDSFYGGDEGDYLLHPKYRALITRTTNRIPRRLQRLIVILAAAFVLFLISWWVYFGPRHAQNKQDLLDMDTAPENSFGKNLRPEFKGMVQVQDLDTKLLPAGERRLIVVGDVHGCKEELKELLKKVDFKQGVDHLILVGDIIAKGPDSPGVVSLATQLGASCVRGNHEDKVLLSIAETSSFHDPAIPGPDEPPERESDTLDEQSFSHGDYKLRKLAKSFTTDQISWLQACPIILRVGAIGDLHNVVVVHAGLVPDIPLESQDPFHAMNMRTIDLKTRLPSEKRDGKPWEKFWNHVQNKKPLNERTTVIYGHDRKRGKNIQEYSMGLDSGCVGGGHLTAMVIEEGGKHEFVQIKCKKYD